MGAPDRSKKPAEERPLGRGTERTPRPDRPPGRSSAPHLATPTADGPFVQLKHGRADAVRRFHPWVLSGSVARVVGDPVDGESVRVASAEGDWLGHGDFAAGSQIRVRLWHFGSEPAPAEDDWIELRLDRALELRRADPALAECEGLRLVNAEGDGLPGLVVDRYAGWLVLKATTSAMLRRAPVLAKRLAEQLGSRGAWLRGDRDTPGRELFGDVPADPVRFRERGRSYLADLRHGQKTGFYLDQRDARDRFQQLAQGREALDLYAYSGGFSVAAEAGGAARVVAVETSAPAIALLRANAAKTEVEAGSVLAYLSRTADRFDLIAVDPPPFARRRRDVPRAARAYVELLVQSFRVARRGGLVMAFSCSHHLGPELFRTLVGQAAAAARREVRILESLDAPADHPVAAVHPEGRYLFGLLLELGQA